MSFVYAIILVIAFSVMFVAIYYLNNKVKIDCDSKENCEGCKASSCFHKKEED